MSNELEQLSKRNAETFNLVVRQQNAKIEELQMRVDTLNGTISTLYERLTTLENRLNVMQIQAMGTKATV